MGGDEVDRVEFRISVANKKLRRYLAKFPHGQRSKWCENALTKAMMEGDKNQLLIRKSELETELNQVKQMLTFHEAEDGNRADLMNMAIKMPEAQRFFEGYAERLHDSYDDGSNPKDIADGWINRLIKDFCEAVKEDFTTAEFRTMFKLWETEKKITG